MRISTSMIYDAGTRGMQTHSSAQYRAQQQISTGKRVLAAADDPLAAAEALVVNQRDQVSFQYKTNFGDIQTALNQEETQLQGAETLLQQIRQLAVQGNSSALTGEDKRGIATQLRALYDQLMGYANSMDAAGQYLFSGYMGNTKPFGGSVDQLNNGGEITYQGDQGQRTIQAWDARQIAVSDPGTDVFMTIKNGNGNFTTAYRSVYANVPTTNTGTGSISGAAFNNRLPNLQPVNVPVTLTFVAAAGTTPAHFTVNPGTGPGPVADIPFAPVNGTQTINVNGISFTLSGTPANNDTFGLTRTAANTGGGMIDGGAITDQLKWADSLKSNVWHGQANNVEVRFWTDTTGLFGTRGAVYYDLVNANNGDSLFAVTATGGTATASTPPNVNIAGYPTISASGSTFTANHRYTSGQIINLSGFGNNGVTDYSTLGNGTGSLGASIIVTGTPQSAYQYQIGGVTHNTTEPTYPDPLTGTPVPPGTIPNNATNVNYYPTPAAGGTSGLNYPGDAFEIAPSQNQSVFKTLANLIGALESGENAPSMSIDIGSAISALDQAEINITRVTTMIGARLGETSNLTTIQQNVDVGYQGTISRLTDTDIAQATTDLTRATTGLQAAQQSYAITSKLTLFNYI